MAFDEVFPNIYRIEVPLPNNPLKAVNSYLIKGQGKYLLIDTGMNREECRRALLSNLKELKVDLGKTDFFITHLHADHLGLLGDLATGTSIMYFNRIEAAFIRQEGRWQEAHRFYLQNGFPEDELSKAMDKHPGYNYGLKQNLSFNIVDEGDRIEIGSYSFRCIETPGHTPGHMCLYEEKQKILVSGDHILFDITPNITYFPGVQNSLKDYLLSLDKIYDLDVKLVLPGHRRIWNNHQERIRQLQRHHQNRVNEIISVLADGEKNAFQIAPRITWDIDCDSWESFPPAQKWFAFGETIAHLRYLKEEGTIRQSIKDNIITYSLKF